jgi:hypothetical protein
VSDTTLPGLMLTGTHAARPSATAVGTGTLYSCTTHSLIYQSLAGSWGTWANLAGTGMPNPMTTTGDIIYSSSGSTPARLAVGSATQVLHGGASVPAYSAVLPADLDVSADNTTANATTGHHGLLPKLDSSASKYLDGSGAWSTPSGGGGGGTTSNFPAQGRLTLTTATAVTTSDVTAATTVYFTPYGGNQVATYSGSAWTLSTFTEKSLSLSGLTASLPYDIFIVDSTLALEAVAWTNATTRATALVLQDGVYVKSGATTRRYLGTICITGTTGQCEDSLLNRLVWNYYNRRPRKLKVTDTTDSWTSSATGWRSWNGSTSNRATIVIGVNEDPVTMDFQAITKQSGGNGSAVGIGLDSTSANSASILASHDLTNLIAGTCALFDDYLGIGSHYLQLLEYDNGATTTFYGDVGQTFSQNGAVGRVWS